MNRWWDGQSVEVFWLETTDRSDIGVDLKAPQRDDSGAEHPAYVLIKEVRDGDVVFHYRKPQRAIVGWSRAVGSVWEEDIVWGAHGTVAREAGRVPYRRPGWRIGLQGPYPLDPPVSLDVLRALEPSVRGVREDLRDSAAGSLYFPFELSHKRPLRPTQFYLTKFPAGLVAAVSELAAAAAEAERTTTTPSTPAPTLEAVSSGAPVGLAFTEADEEAATSERQPFSVDPAVMDRGTRGHAKTLNALAAHVRQGGNEPRRPRPDEPQFDLAWETPEAVFVAEVKSLTVTNGERQLRLGLGQVLRYRQLLRVTGKSVRAVLAVEREPFDSSWNELCSQLSVSLVWPSKFDDL